jgi:hypothetical protein
MQKVFIGVLTAAKLLEKFKINCTVLALGIRFLTDKESFFFIGTSLFCI